MRSRFAPMRDFYIPHGAEMIQDKQSSAVAYIAKSRKSGRLNVVLFHGAAQQPDHHWDCRNATQAGQCIKEHFESIRAAAVAKAKRKAERNQPRALQVGDILVASWGYEQTNVDWYEVVALVGATQVEIVQICADRTFTSSDSGTCAPCPGKPINGATPTRRKVTHGTSVRFARYKTATKWDGKPRYWSSYA